MYNSAYAAGCCNREGGCVEITVREEAHAPRMNIRMTDEARAIIERAAMLEGRTMSDFVLASAVEKARETVAAHQQIVLSQRDSEIFAEAIINPPKPSDALRAAVAEYRTRFGT